MSEKDSGVDTGSESNESNSMSVETPPRFEELELHVPEQEPQGSRDHEFSFKNNYSDYEQNLHQCKMRTFGEIGSRTLLGKSRHRDFIKNKVQYQIKLRKAVFSNSVEQVRKLLAADYTDINVRDVKRRTLLHFAASFGYNEIVRVLLEHGADPNLKDVLGNTPLHLAACISHIETVTLLLKAGTDVNSFNKSGQSPLHLAQSKLKLLRMSKSYTSLQLKEEVLQILEMMQVYLQRSGQSSEVYFLSEFTNRIHFHQTREEVNHDLGDLLNNLSHLSL